MAEVTIKLSVFATKTFYLDNGEDDQVLISPPTYNKAKVAEGYDKTLVGKLELDEQDLVFSQETEDSPVILKELKVSTRGFNLIFVDMEFRNHNDGKMKRGLLAALAKKRSG